MKAISLRGMLSIVATMLIASATVQAANIAGNSLKSYKIVYSAQAEAEEGIDAATRLQASIEAATGVKLDICDDNSKTAPKEILLGQTNRPESEAAYADKFGPFEYKASIKKGKLIIAGGGWWAMDKAGKLASEQLQKGLPSSYKLEGTVEGEFLFPREEGVNLRIFDENIWYHDEPTPKLWLDAGKECTNEVRAPQFAQLVRAYMPDIVAFQERSMRMRDQLNPKIAKYGFVEAFEIAQGGRNDTPILYNTNTVKLIKSNYVLFTPEKWNNNETKSYTWALFKLKENGKNFIIISTHLWWKQDKDQPGSTQARAAQIRLIMAEVEDLVAQFNCPVFMMGDLNCTEDQIPLKQLTDGGYIPCEKAATHLSDKFRGHHVCYAYAIGSRVQGDLPRSQAIDHCYLYNGKDTEIRNFLCDTSAFTILLTDHNPHIIDSVLK